MNVLTEPRFLLALGAGAVAAVAAAGVWLGRRTVARVAAEVAQEESPTQTWVEIGGQRMTQAQYDAARWPLLHGAGPDDL